MSQPLDESVSFQKILAEFVMNYAGHISWCATKSMSTDQEAQECNCGFDDALKRLEERHD